MEDPTPTPPTGHTPDEGPSPYRLPSVGHRLDLTDDGGAPVSIVRLKDGTLVLETGGSRVQLDASQAKALGTLASGRFLVHPDLIDRTERLLGGLEFDWVELPAHAKAVGHSIEALQIRRRTGVTIVAILRGSLPVVDPDPSEVLAAGDELVVACRTEDRAALERFLVEGA